MPRTLSSYPPKCNHISNADSSMGAFAWPPCMMKARLLLTIVHDSHHSIITFIKNTGENLKAVDACSANRFEIGKFVLARSRTDSTGKSNHHGKTSK
eukprot:1083170-Amphidinium_carterae.1